MILVHFHFYLVLVLYFCIFYLQQFRLFFAIGSTAAFAAVSAADFIIFLLLSEANFFVALLNIDLNTFDRPSASCE